MPCYHPIDAWLTANGVLFRETSTDSKQIKLPCGRCIGCRLERSRQWALRLTHEKRFHQESCFITLTYDEANLPKDGSLNLKHFQDFMKRFRKEASPNKIRFFHAGEYGESKGRPHYHAIIFGEDFDCKCVNHRAEKCDVYDVLTTPRGDTTWSNEILADLWPFGMHRIGQVTFESCAYVARYVTKKITGPKAKSHYERICETTGEIFQLKPEYATMSRRPGIGHEHFQKFHTDIFPSDECISRGHPSKPPKFYDKQLEKLNPGMYAEIKDQRECALSLASKYDRTPRRLADREIVKLAQLSSLKRNYEIG